MRRPLNPFTIGGYISPEYFCDRETETRELINHLTNHNNVALISTRRLGKTGLIYNCFEQPAIKDTYNTFFVDIYSTGSLREFVYSLSKEILKSLKPRGRMAIEAFWNSVRSIQAGISFDPAGVPSFNLQLGDLRHSETTLDEIFDYLENADKPCIVAIDEFQQISRYPEKNVEALLRTCIQKCTNTQFVFAGSQRHIMGNMFTNASRPFFQSVTIMHLSPIPLKEYVQFAQKQFSNYGKSIDADVVERCYSLFDGITWYVQKMLNTMFSITEKGQTCHTEFIEEALCNILDSMDYVYSEMIFRLPDKQKELLYAINREGIALNITSGQFVRRHSLLSSSSVQAAAKGLLERDFITHEQGEYRIYDRFLSLWLKQR